MKNSEKILKEASLWNTALEDLYEAAAVAVGTYAGTRNFLTAAVVAIIDYAYKKPLYVYKCWENYYFEIVKMNEHAENFDFYMRILKHYYGC